MRSKASLQRPSDTVREFGSNVASETPRQRPPPSLPRVEQPCLNACKSKTDPPSSHFQNPVRLFQTARHTERPSSHCEKDRRPDTIPTTPRDSLRRQKPASPTGFVHFSSHRKTPSTTASPSRCRADSTAASSPVPSTSSISTTKRRSPIGCTNLEKTSQRPAGDFSSLTNAASDASAGYRAKKSRIPARSRSKNTVLPSAPLQP